MQGHRLRLGPHRGRHEARFEPDRGGGRLPEGLHDDRHVEQQRRPRLRLLDHEGDLEAAARRLAQVAELRLQPRRPGLLDVVGEEPAEVLARRGLERLPHVRERGLLPAVLAVEAGRPLPEGVVSDPLPDHVEDHQRLPVPHRLGRRAVARAELGEREVAPVAHVAAVLLQGVAPVLLAPPPLLLDEVVGHVGGQALAPVPARVVHEDRVAPPVVEDLVRVGGAQDEREADDLGAEQRVGRHAVARLPEVLDERELPVRVGPDEPAVHLDVLRGRLQVLRGERVVLLAQVDEGLDRARRVAVDHDRPAHQGDLVDRPVRLPACRALRVARGAVARAHHVPALGLRHLDVVLDEAGADVRVPEPVAGEVDAVLRDDPGRLAEAARVLLLLVGEAEVELPLVPQAHRAARRGSGHAVALERHRGGRAVDAEEAHGVAQRHLGHRGLGGGDLQPGVQQELASFRGASTPPGSRG